MLNWRNTSDGRSHKPHRNHRIVNRRWARVGLETLESRDLLSISPIASATGKVDLSVDGLGSSSLSGGIIQVQKPSAGATVHAAYLAGASTGFSGYTLQDGDITIDGVPVIWDTVIPSSISSTNGWADVTSLVKSKIDAAAAGRIDFSVTESNVSSDIDGEILAVIFDDPAQTTDNTVALLFGAQSTSGDTFSVLLGDPIDKTDPNLSLDMSLGISFGFQPSSPSQYSQVDVNGQRLTSSAGAQDDGESQNGALLTVGGLDDSDANPADPLIHSTDPRYDDELYNLLPFVNNGDTTISVNTLNPSNDDNIFFGAFNLKSNVAVVGEGVVLTPTTQTHTVGDTADLTATVQDDNGDPIANRTVTFTVVSGPDAGDQDQVTTDANGQAVLHVNKAGQTTGTDVWVAQFTDDQSQLQTSNQVDVIWEAPPTTISINNVTQNEGNSLTTPFVFTVTLSGASTLPVIVEYSTAEGSAKTPQDFAAQTGTITFAPGVTSMLITIGVVGDTAVEPDESFTVTLSNPTNATISTATGTGTILNDDSALSPVVTTDLSKAKQGGSTLPIQLQVFDGSGNNVSSPSLPVHVLGIGTSPNQPVNTLSPASDSGNSNPGGLFRNVGGSYMFNLKLVDGSGKALKAGTYYLFYTIGNDPTVQTLAFIIK